MIDLSYVFIDESGDPGLYGSRYLVLAALIVSNPKALDRIIKNMRRNKFKKELKKASEISSETIITYMVSALNGIKTAKVLYVVLEKKKLISEYLKNNKDELYNYVAGKLAKQLIFNNASIEVRIDRRHGKQLLRQDFNNYFMKCLQKNSSPTKVTIEHSYSHNFAGLQFADILAWACFQKFEHHNNKFIDVLNINQEVYHVW